MSDLVKRLMSDHPGDDMREVYFSDEAPNFNIDPFNGDTSCGKCGGCGAWLTVVRPGKAQCDFCEGDYDAATRWAAAARIEELETRLEITHCYRMDPETGETTRCELTEEERKTFPDAVDCRDATIALLDDRIKELEAKLATARNDALEEAAKVAFAHTPDKHTAALASHVTGRTIETAIRALKSTNQT